jgi:hypothetical protein
MLSDVMLLVGTVTTKIPNLHEVSNLILQNVSKPSHLKNTLHDAICRSH